jgi:hypothetical protein
MQVILLHTWDADHGGIVPTEGISRRATTHCWEQTANDEMQYFLDDPVLH